jgi:hypothetical protein
MEEPICCEFEEVGHEGQKTFLRCLVCKRKDEIWGDVCHPQVQCWVGERNRGAQGVVEGEETA